MTTQSPPAGDRLTILRRALDTIPDLHVSPNKVSLTLSFGEDGDRLYVDWDERHQSYRIWYQADPGGENHAERVFRFFTRLPAQNEQEDSIKINKSGNKATIWCGRTVASVSINCESLAKLLSKTTLNNAKIHGGPIKPKDKLQNPADYFADTAKLINAAVKSEIKLPQQNWRQALGFDLVDEFITIGYTQSAGKVYREHVIPVVLIKNHAFRITEAGASTEEVAHFIECHLFIITITADEADLLNCSPSGIPGRTLKDSMPRDWCWGDNPLDRLWKAGIHPCLTRSIPRWEPEQFARTESHQSLRKRFWDFFS